MNDAILPIPLDDYLAKMEYLFIDTDELAELARLRIIETVSDPTTKIRIESTKNLARI